MLKDRFKAIALKGLQVLERTAQKTKEMRVKEEVAAMAVESLRSGLVYLQRAEVVPYDKARIVGDAIWLDVMFEVSEQQIDEIIETQVFPLDASEACATLERAIIRRTDGHLTFAPPQHETGKLTVWCDRTGVAATVGASYNGLLLAVEVYATEPAHALAN